MSRENLDGSPTRLGPGMFERTGQKRNRRLACLVQLPRGGVANREAIALQVGDPLCDAASLLSPRRVFRGRLGDGRGRPKRHAQNCELNQEPHCSFVAGKALESPWAIMT